MAGHRGGGGLLERLVGEQPARGVGEAGELGGGLAAQQGGLDQYPGAVGITVPDGGDVTEPGVVGQREPGDVGQSGRSGLAGQVADIGTGEAQEGLTPVIMTA